MAGRTAGSGQLGHLHRFFMHLHRLIGQMAKCCETNPVFGKTLRVLGLPSFSSQSAICCIAAPLQI
jgi:hypothetical protein